MLPLGLLLLPIVFAGHNKMETTNYAAKNTLKSIQTIIGPHSDQLDLSGLGIESIDKDVFKDWKHLKNLNLTNNSLTNLPEFLFANLKNLENLSLADNRLKEFNNTFVGLNNLKFLNISNNPFNSRNSVGESYFGKNCFFGLPKICKISILGLTSLSVNRALFEDPRSSSNDSLRQEIERERVTSRKMFTRTNRISKRKQLKTYFVNGTLQQYATQEHSSSTFTSVMGGKDRDFELAKICIQEGRVESLEAVTMREYCVTKNNSCVCVPMSYKFGQVFIFDMHISSFKNGWYRISNSSIHGIDIRDNDIVQVTRELLNDLPKEITSVNLQGNRIKRLAKGIIENKNLETLDFSGNFISEIEDGALENTTLKNLWLGRNRLNNTKFAATLPSTLVSLELDYNRISTISDNSFVNLYRLEKLDMTSNGLTELRSQSLRGLSSLQTAFLQDNQIEKIESKAFQDLKVLTLLYLRNNSIANLEKGVFKGLEKIKIFMLGTNNLTRLSKDSLEGLPDTLADLDLRNNKLEKLEADTFVKIPSYILDLSRNRLSKIENGSFDLPSLHYLDLSYNSFTNIDSDSFKGLPDTLAELHLSGNMLEKVTSGTFVRIPFRNLNLSDNRLSKIEKGSFDLPNLYRLDLSNNSISNIDGDSFAGLGKLRVLLLESNNITKIKKGAMKNMGNLLALSIGGNPIKELENGALFGLQKNEECYMSMQNNQISLIHGGIFDDV